SACGVERWAVKTLMDPGAAHVRPTPIQTTVARQRRLPRGRGRDGPLLLRARPAPRADPSVSVNSLGSWLGYERGIARQARDARSGPAGAAVARDGTCASSSGGCAGCDGEAPSTSAGSPGTGSR